MKSYGFGFLRDFFSTTGKELIRVHGGRYKLTQYDGGYPVSLPVRVWEFAKLSDVVKHATTFGA